MSTSFYVEIPKCAICRRPKQRFHIGERSGGWKFLWQGYLLGEDSPTGEPLKTLGQWADVLWVPTNVIKDEYGSVYTPTELLKMTKEWNDDPKNGLQHAKEHGADSWVDESGENFLGRNFG